MVLVELGCGSYCIDATEVTRGAYDAFVAAAPSTEGQPEGCAFNKSFAPSCPVGGTPSSDPSLPAVCVDFCDAAAYCKWAGKKLCTGMEQPQQPGRWEEACLATVGSESPTVCNTSGGKLHAAGSGDCAGDAPPLSSLHDMIGNAAEWVDDCFVEEGVRYCLTMGGGAQSVGARCVGGLYDELPYSDPLLGFRCCAD